MPIRSYSLASPIWFMEVGWRQEKEEEEGAFVPQLVLLPHISNLRTESGWRTSLFKLIGKCVLEQKRCEAIFKNI